MPHLDIYWSFRSPYSYLALSRLEKIIARDEITHSMRFVRPLALREDKFFKKVRPQWLPYLIKDVVREAEMLGVPFAAPQPDPITMNMETGDVATEQPNMMRLMNIGIAAEISAQSGFTVAKSIADKIWSGLPGWNESNQLKNAIAQAGHSLETLENWAADNTTTINDALKNNEHDQMVHHWGVPLMVLDNEPYFGQDRINTLEWYLDTQQSE